jgi:hypothetical protein
MNRGLAARIFDLSARIGGLSAGVMCGKGHKVSVSHISEGNRTRFVIIGTMGFGGTWASGRDHVMVVQTTIVVVVVVVVVYMVVVVVSLVNCRKVLESPSLARASTQ